MTEAKNPGTTSGWTRFWDRGGWWKALALIAVYLLLYELAGLAIGAIWGDQVDAENILATPQSIFFGIAAPIIVGAILLVLFAISVGWLKPLFSKQPIAGRWWMWIAPAVVLVAAALRIAGTDWSRYSVDVVVTLFATGLVIGFAEELATRGLAVTLLRKAGYTERVVMLLSSLLFALMHSVNLITGQPLPTVLLTMVFTFVFGVAMYLSLRVTGNLIWPILLHAITDPTTLLVAGGVDTATGEVSPLGSFAGNATWAYLVITIVAIFLVRGRVIDRQHALD
jgi:membrane protease YdiL (CAAX protease family)